MTHVDIAYQEALEAEFSLLSGVIDRRTDMDTPAHLSSLDPDDFMSPAHRAIWAALQAITAGGGLVDSWALAKAMTKLGATGQDLQVAEGLFAQGYLVRDCADLRPRIAKVADSSKRRTLARAMGRLAERAVTEDLKTVEEEFSEVAAKMAQAGNPRLRSSTDYSQQFESFLAGRAILPPESRRNLMATGIPGIDDVIVANPGRLIVIGGLPSAGKTALAIQAAVRTSQAGYRVAMGSLEMDADEISARIVACACGVNSLIALRTGCSQIGPEDRRIIEGVRKNLVGIHGCAGDSWTSLEAAIVREHRRSRLSLAIVDYLQLMGEPDTKRKNETEAQAIGEITKAAKKLAQRLGINVVLLSQFNRKVEEGQEPTLQHFLGSGQIERDIDIALLLWNQSGIPMPSVKECVVNCRIAKNRGGERYGKVRLRFHKAFNQFTEEPQRLTDAYDHPSGAYASPEPIIGG